jgi:hypothetical protein
MLPAGHSPAQVLSLTPVHGPVITYVMGGPILAGVQIRRHDHVPTRLTPIDQDYEHLRTDMATLFSHLGIQPGPATA